jgi:hypothetical protein
MTIDATVGTSTANSYVTLVEADAYLATRVGAATWVDLEQDQKEAYLLTANRQLEIALWNGLKQYPSVQALSFPRTGLVDYDSQVITGIPKKLKEAQLELAYWLLTEGDRYMSDTDLQQISKLSIGPLNLEVSKSATIFPLLVDQLMQAIGPGVLMKSPGANTASAVSFVR